MSSVTEIEIAIQKLSVAEQRIIALHLGERLVDEKPSKWGAAPDEGIRFLAPYEEVQTPRESRGGRARQRTAAVR